MNRRKFIEMASLSTFWLSMHGHLNTPAAGADQIKAGASANPLILDLRLQTAADLSAMVDFYHGKLGLPVRTKVDNWQMAFRLPLTIETVLVCADNA